jgi:hypothetical protein
LRCIELRQFSSRGLNNRRKSLALASLEQGFRICATEAFDHRAYYNA